MLGGGAVLTWLIGATDCFRMGNKRPFFRGMITRLFVCKIVAEGAMAAGLGMLAALFTTPFLSAGLGWSYMTSLMLPVFGIVILWQFATAFLDLWPNIGLRSLQRALLEDGRTQPELDAGLFVGVSDPDNRRLQMVCEDDIGMPWIYPDHLLYHGDSQRFELRRDQIIDIERKIDYTSVSAYGGAVHVVLCWRDDREQERRTQLPPEGYWTAKQRASALDALGDQLTAWRENPNPHEVASVRA